MELYVAASTKLHGRNYQGLGRLSVFLPVEPHSMTLRIGIAKVFQSPGMCSLSVSPSLFVFYSVFLVLSRFTLLCIQISLDSTETHAIKIFYC